MIQASSLEKILLGATKVIIVLILLTPLVLGPFGLSFSEYPKVVFFRTLTEILFIFYLALVWLNKKYLPKISLLLLSVLIFYIISPAGIFFSANPHLSFWGSLEHSGGFVTFLHFLLFFWVIVSVLRGKKDWFLTLKWAVIVSGISSMAAIIQKLGFFSFYGVSLPARISGTLSNPDYFAPYILLNIFLGWFLAVKSARKEKFIWLAVTALNCFTLVLSGTRGAWVGVIFGVIVFGILWFIFNFRDNPLLGRRILWVILILSSVILAVVVSRSQFGIGNSFFLGRLFSIFDVSQFGGRLAGWEISLRAFYAKPLLGWGDGLFGFVYDKYFEAEYLRFIPESKFFLNAHNKILGLLATAGILGTLSYIFIFITIFISFFRSYAVSLRGAKRRSNPDNFYRSSLRSSREIASGSSPKANYPRNDTSRLILISLFAAYFVQNLFIFDSTGSYLMFFLILGFVYYLSCGGSLLNSASDRRRYQKNIISLNSVFYEFFAGILIIFLALLSLFSIYSLNIKPTLAGMNFLRGVKVENHDFNKAAMLYNKSITSGTAHDDELKMALVRKLMMTLDGNQSMEHKRGVSKILIESLPLVGEIIKRPGIRYLDGYELLARIYTSAYSFNNDKKLLDRAEKIVLEAIDFNNEFPRFYRILGEINILRGDYDAGEGYFEKSFNLSPRGRKDYIMFYNGLGIVYLRAGNKTKSEEYFQLAKNLQSR